MKSLAQMLLPGLLALAATAAVADTPKPVLVKNLDTPGLAPFVQRCFVAGPGPLGVLSCNAPSSQNVPTGKVFVVEYVSMTALTSTPDTMRVELLSTDGIDLIPHISPGGGLAAASEAIRLYVPEGQTLKFTGAGLGDPSTFTNFTATAFGHLESSN